MMLTCCRQAAKEKAAQEKESFNRTLSMSHGGSRRGGDRGDHTQVGPDGWVAGGPAARPAKAGDLSQFGKINTGTPMTFERVPEGRQKVEEPRGYHSLPVDQHLVHAQRQCYLG